MYKGKMQKELLKRGYCSFQKVLRILAESAGKPALSLLSSRWRRGDLPLEHSRILSRHRWERVLVARVGWRRGAQVDRQGGRLVGLGLAEGDAVVVDALSGRGPVDGAVVATSGIGLVARRVGVPAGGGRRHGLIRTILVRQGIDVLRLAAVGSQVGIGGHPLGALARWALAVASSLAVVTAGAGARGIVAAAVVVVLVFVVAVPLRGRSRSSILATLASEGGRTAAVVALLGESRLVG